MGEKLKPFEIIQQLAEYRKDWTDETILAELGNLPVLPDEDDPAWDQDQTWKEHAYVFLALADVASERRLREALPLLLEKACYGDPGEIMRGLRHNLEGIVNPDWSYLTEVCIQAAHSKEKGSRLWAVDELGILREAEALQTLISALSDPAGKVRQQAVWSLVMLCQTNQKCRQPAIEALTRYVRDQNDEYDQKDGLQAIKDIEGLNE